MTYTDALQKLLTVRWKVQPCNSGETCWCRTIVPEEIIIFDNGEEMYVVPAGTINKATAEHIVKIHNKNIFNNE